ncbi:DUF1492 domain-containing protein [Facklamia hominis]
MTPKEFLQQAFYLDHRINSKIEQIDSLNSLAQKATSTLSDMPKAPGRNISRLEEIIVKVVMLEEEINKDIDELVDLKVKITEVINEVPDKEQQMVLEKRYLNFLSFEQIAVDLNFSIQHVFRIHKQALCSTEAILIKPSR